MSNRGLQGLGKLLYQSRFRNRGLTRKATLMKESCTKQIVNLIVLYPKHFPKFPQTLILIINHFLLLFQDDNVKLPKPSEKKRWIHDPTSKYLHLTTFSLLRCPICISIFHDLILFTRSVIVHFPALFSQHRRCLSDLN